MSAYAHPIYAIDPLIAQMQRILGNDINYPALVKSPSWQSLQPLWERIVEFTFGITRDYLKTPKYDALDAFSHPDIHDDVVTMRAIFIKTKKVASMSKCLEFTLYDLTTPEPKRLVAVLSAVVNLLLFIEERRKEVNNAQQGARETNKLLTEGAIKNSIMASKLEELRASEAAEQPEAEKLLADAEASERRGEELMKQAEAHREQMTATQRQYNNLVQQVQQINTRIHASRKQIEQFKNALAPESPGKLQRKLEELDQKLGDMETQIAQDEVAQVQLQQSLDVSTMVHERMMHAVSNLQQANGKLAEKKAAVREMKEVVEAVQKLQARATRLQCEVDGVSWKRSEAVASQDKLTSEAEAQMELARQEVESIRGATEVAKSKVKTRQAKIDELEKQVAALEGRQRDAQARLDADRRQLHSAAYAIRDDLYSYKNALMVVLDQEMVKFVKLGVLSDQELGVSSDTFLDATNSADNNNNTSARQ